MPVVRLPLDKRELDHADHARSRIDRSTSNCSRSWKWESMICPCRKRVVVILLRFYFYGCCSGIVPRRRHKFCLGGKKRKKKVDLWLNPRFRSGASQSEREPGRWVSGGIPTVCLLIVPKTWEVHLFLAFFFFCYHMR